MKRRVLLGGLAGAFAATAGCVGSLPGVGGEPPLKLRTMRADPEPAGADPANVTHPTDVTCTLSAAFVDEHPALRRMLDRAGERPVGEMVTTGIPRSTGDDLVAGLESHCERTGGLYFYEGEAFWVSIAFTSAGDAAAHHEGDGHEGHNHTHTSR